MSWFKENYHIAALGGGVLVLGGLAYLGFSGNKTVNDEFTANNPRPGDVATVEGGELATYVTTSVSEMTPVEHRRTEKGRPVDVFTSVNLYTRGKNSRELLDLLSMDKPLHPPIENQWWVDHSIDPSFSDSPQQDEDEDGFTNLEEFEAKTDPNDAKSHGDLITKLEVATVESDLWLLRFNSVLGSGYQFNLQYKAFGGRTQTNRIPASQAVNEGDTFFKEEPAKDRFVLKKIEEREEMSSTGKIKRNWAIVEDQRPNKKGQSYELPFKLRAGNQSKAIRYDHTVVFSLNAIGEAANTFRIEENGEFTLPNGTEGGTKYKLVEVKLGEDRRPVSVVVQTGDDEKMLTEIPVPAAKEEAADQQ